MGIVSSNREKKNDNLQQLGISKSTLDLDSVSEEEINGYPNANVEVSFGKKKILEWNSLDLVEFVELITLNNTIEKLCGQNKLTFDLENGEDFMRCINTPQEFNIIINGIDDAQVKLIFETLALHIKFRKVQYLTLDFYRVLLKILFSFEKCDSEINFSMLCNKSVYEELERMCYELSDVNALKEYYGKVLCEYVKRNMKKNPKKEKYKKIIYEEQKKLINILDTKEEKEDKQMKEEKFIPVKLVITESTHSELKRTLKKMISPFIKKLPQVRSDFGMFHVALLIGNLYLEWTNIGLIRLKVIQSEMALCLIDFDTVHSLKYTLNDISRVLKIAEKISDLVCVYNTKMTYSVVNGSLKVNCHQFVNDMMNRLDMSYPKHIYSDFFKSIQSGRSDLIFCPSKELRVALNLKSKYVFETHKEVDKISAIILKYNSNHEDSKLLRAYDRAFWLRLMKINVKIEEVKRDIQLYRSELDDLIQNIHSCPKDNSFSEKIEQLKELIKVDEKKLNRLNKRRNLYTPIHGSCTFGDPRGTSSLPNNIQDLKKVFLL